MINPRSFSLLLSWFFTTSKSPADSVIIQWQHQSLIILSVLLKVIPNVLSFLSFSSLSPSLFSFFSDQRSSLIALLAPEKSKVWSITWREHPFARAMRHLPEWKLESLTLFYYCNDFASVCASWYSKSKGDHGTRGVNKSDTALMHC